jgi:hypothetical protein
MKDKHVIGERFNKSGFKYGQEVQILEYIHSSEDREILRTNYLQCDYQFYAVPDVRIQRNHFLSAPACHILQMEILSWPSHVDAEFWEKKAHSEYSSA